jgi:tRNA(Ile)-lysidine synthase
MAYSPQMRAAIGRVRRCFAQAGLGKQSAVFSTHGKHEADPDAPLVLVACSGGRDSLALACVAHIVAGMNGLRCGAVVVDHQLQEGSHEVARTAAGTCEQLGLAPVEVRTVHVNASGTGIEAGARDARYEQLVAVAKELNAAAVLVAHTRDDQVETVLIGMARSSSPAAVAGMPRSTVRSGVAFLRPLLDLSRADTTAICEQQHLQWWDDPSNGDNVSETSELAELPLRSRIRQTVIPALVDVAGDAVMEHIALIAESVRADQEYLESVARAGLRDCIVDSSAVGNGAADGSAARAASGSDARNDSLFLSAAKLARLEEPVRLRALRIAIEEHGGTPTRDALERVNDLVVNWHGQSEVRISSKFSVNRVGHVIELCQDRTHANS